ncbi:uncharacterized protein CTRU02_212547 [Colletotrichum truncatum]|uniref:Uncharacterized protein n=1 Tax=Colletotrichum truncatum TaxID=5467 RepID=A0ACC3YI58_COLTU
MDGQLPSTIQEAEALVLSLYEPAPPDTISRIQETLHRLQRSPSGWWIARDLLGHADDKVKFFGALTLIIKLNTESSSLTDNDASELLQNLMGWFVNSLDDGSGAMVIRKLSSALVTFFLSFPGQWELCIRHLCCSLSKGASLPLKSIDAAIDLPSLLQTLSPRKFQAALWFAGTLVDEASKVEMNSAKNMGLYDTLMRNAPDVLALMSHGFDRDEPVDLTNQGIRQDSITCLQSWIWFSQRVSSHNDELVGSLRALMQPTISALTNDDLYDVSVELLSDILSNYSGFLTEDHYESLFSLFETQWSHDRYQRLVEGDFDFDSVQFGQLMISLGDSKVQSLIHSVDDRSLRFLARLRGLLSAQGYPVSEDKVFVPALEFWSTYVETLTDCIYSEESQSKAWVASATSQVLEAVSTVWRRVAYPPPSVVASWDSADRSGFSDARKDVADLLQSTFTVTGPPLLSTFANLTIQSLSPNSWSDLEAATFCLGSLADCVAGDARCDDTLRAVFSSPLFELLQTTQEIVPGRTRQTCISLIERYADYFERETQSLPAALNLLFSVLGDSQLAGPAARSIQRLCFSSRSILASETSAFLAQYQTIVSRSQLDCIASERIIGAISAVIQAVPEEQERLGHLEVLLSFVEHDARKAMHMLSLPDASPELQDGLNVHRCSTLVEPFELPLHMALKVLRCLTNIGKGLQAPSDLPFDLESENDHTSVNQGSKLGQLQSRIMSMIVELQALFPQSGEVAECICSILKTGFSEVEPGPFVFPSQLVCDYLAEQTFRVPRIGLFVSTACSFLSSLRTRKRGHVEIIRTKLLAWVIGLLQQLSEPENDTELAQNGIEFTNRLISREPASLFQPECLPLAEFFFMYALQILDGREPLPKAAAADFWATFMALKHAEERAQDTIDHATAHLGPMLAQSIVRNIGGNASRSELDRLSEPLKKMVSHHTKARAWLEAALFDASFPSRQISDEDKTIFLKKIIR